jgi:DNA primase catalytic core
MARIPDEAIVHIKQSTDIIALIQSRGTTLKQKGSNWIGLCPFHTDTKTPNLIVTPGKGLFRCMAADCGKTGNVIQFVQWHDGLSFRHAFELLDKGGKAAFEHSTKQPKKSHTVKLDCPVKSDEKDNHAMLNKVADYYHTRLTSPDGKAVIEYLKTRGLDLDETTLKKFRIGVSDRTLGLRIPSNQTLKGKAIREQLKDCGIYRKKTGREHLIGCLTIPITNLQGETTQIYGRRIGKINKADRHLYLAKKQEGIFNAEILRPGHTREIILCESIIDALTFHHHGMENVTCTYGTSNLSNELIEAIKAAKIETVKLAFDADKSGEEATSKVAAILQNLGIQVYQMKFPWGTDANQYAKDQGKNALQKSVRDAQVIELKSQETLPLTEATKSQKSAEDPSNESRAPSFLAASLAAEAVDFAAKEKKVSPTEETLTESKVELKQVGDYHELAQQDRLYRIGGLHKNNTLEVLRITLRITHEGLMHVDSLDLYRDGERRKYIDRASEETLLSKDLIKRDIGKLLLALEQSQEDRLNAPAEETETKQLTTEEETEALELLQSSNLLERITKAYDKAGIVGEATNKLAAYLACVSRKLSRPLAVIIQSTSAAGKSALMDAVLSFFPAEEQIKYSAMTGQSLYYLGETNLKHKILAIVEEEGAEKASYALKLLQSEGELTIASTGKDPHSGRMETQEYHVEGPVAICLTTTSIDIDEELMNRCLVLTVDESKAQTERIHKLQREARTIEGIIASEERKTILTQMQNAQRLIKPMRIANPYAQHLTFTSGRTRTRRDHEKYLTLIDTIALLHQHQRKLITHQLGQGSETKEIHMLPVTLDDIEAANALAPEVLGRSLDELPPQTRRLLESIKELVRKKIETIKEQKLSTFTRKELRDLTSWSQTQIRRHLDNLIELEYITTQGARNGVLMRYELLGDPKQGSDIYHIGLIDTEKLRKKEQLKKAAKEKNSADEQE